MGRCFKVIPRTFDACLGNCVLRVLTANGVDMRIAAREEVMATPLVSRYFGF